MASPIIDLQAIISKLGVPPSVAKQAAQQIANPVAGALNAALRNLSTKGVLNPLLGDLKEINKEINKLQKSRASARQASVESGRGAAEARARRAESAGRALLRNAQEIGRAQDLAVKRLESLQRRTENLVKSDFVSESERRQLQSSITRRQAIISDISGGTSSRSVSALNRLGNESKLIGDITSKIEERTQAEITGFRQTRLTAQENNKVATLIEKANNARQSAILKATKLLDLERSLNAEAQKTAGILGGNVSPLQFNLGGQAALAQAQRFDPKQIIQDAQRAREKAIQTAFEAEVQQRVAKTGRSDARAREVLNRSIQRFTQGDTGRFFGIGGIEQFTPRGFGLADISHQVDTAQNAYKLASTENKKLQSEITKTNKALNEQSRRFAAAQYNAQKFGEQIGLAVRRYSAFLIGTSALYVVLGSIREATQEALKFEKAQTRLAQILGTNRETVRGIVDEAKRAAQATGTGATETLAGVDILAQAGFQDPRQLKETAELLSKVPLTATFGSIEETADGLIAVIQQFPEFNKELTSNEKIFDLLNKVAADYAVEVKDIFEALKRGGSVLSETGAGFRESVELITLLRSRTREAAPTIGNFFKSIGFRLFRPQNEEVLKQLGVTATDLPTALKQTSTGFQRRFGEGNLQDNVEAIRLASKIAGVYQGGRFLALIQAIQDDQGKFAQTLTGVPGSFGRESQKRLDDVGTSLRRIQESVNALVSTIVQSNSLRQFFAGFADGAQAVSQFAQNFAELLPLVAGLTGAVVLPGLLGKITRGARGTFGAFGQDQRVLITKEDERFRVLAGRVGGREIDLRANRRERFIRSGEQFNIADRARFETLLASGQEQRIAEIEARQARVRPISSLLGGTFVGTDFRSRRTGLSGLRNSLIRGADRNRFVRFASRNPFLASAGVGLLGAGLAGIGSSIEEGATSRTAIGTGAFLRTAGTVAGVGASAAAFSGPAAPLILAGTALVGLSAGAISATRALNQLARTQTNRADEERRRSNRAAGVSALTDFGADIRNLQNRNTRDEIFSEFSKLLTGPEASEEFIKNLTAIAGSFGSRGEAQKFIDETLRALSFDTELQSRLEGLDAALSGPLGFLTENLGVGSQGGSVEELINFRKEFINFIIKNLREGVKPSQPRLIDPINAAIQQYITSAAKVISDARFTGEEFGRGLGQLQDAATRRRSAFEFSPQSVPAFARNQDFLRFASQNLGPQNQRFISNTVSLDQSINNLIDQVFSDVQAQDVQSNFKDILNDKLAKDLSLSDVGGDVGKALSELLAVTRLDPKELIKNLVGKDLNRSVFTEQVLDAAGVTESVTILRTALQSFNEAINNSDTILNSLNDQFINLTNTIRDNENQQRAIVFGGQIRNAQRNVQLGSNPSIISALNTQEIGRLRSGVYAATISSGVSLLPLLQNALNNPNLSPDQRKQLNRDIGDTQRDIAQDTNTLKNALDDLSKALSLAEQNTDIAAEQFDKLRSSLISAADSPINLTSRQGLSVSNFLGFLGQSGTQNAGLDLATGRLGIPNINIGALRDVFQLFSSPTLAGLPLNLLTGGRDSSSLGTIGNSIGASIGARNIAAAFGGRPGFGSRAEIQSRVEQALLDSFRKEEDSRKEEDQIRKEMLDVLKKLQELPNAQLNELKTLVSDQNQIRQQIIDSLESLKLIDEQSYKTFNEAVDKFASAAEKIASNSAKAEVKIIVDPMTLQIAFADKLLDVKLNHVKRNIAVAVEKGIKEALGQSVNVQDNLDTAGEGQGDR